ncbi:hypothetical protein VTN96DRAFT_5252 [Rasamsonia emersonii]
MVQELNSLSAYEAELQKPGVVVIDFYSPQCGPCAVVAPLFENLSKKQYGKRTREIQKTAEVTWWPTFVIYRDGKEEWRAKVPNPPQEHPLGDLTRRLEDVTSKKRWSLRSILLGHLYQKIKG